MYVPAFEGLGMCLQSELELTKARIGGIRRLVIA